MGNVGSKGTKILPVFKTPRILVMKSAPFSSNKTITSGFSPLWEIIVFANRLAFSFNCL